MASTKHSPAASLNRARRHPGPQAVTPAASPRRGALALLALLLAFVAPASAQSVEEFYKGKTITIIVGVTPGGSYDMYARLLARFIGKHIPGNPDVIVQNLQGGPTHVMAAQYLENTAPKDGTAIATFTAGIATDSLLEPEKAVVDFNDLAFIGSISHDLRACYTWHELGVKRWDDLLKKELKYGTANRNSYSYQAAAVLKNLLGVNVKIILGYPGSSERRIAIESGELNAYCGSWVSTPKDWVKDKKIDVFVRFSKYAADDMPEGVPYVRDLAKSEADKQILDLLFAASEVAPPYAVSKEVPADRIEALRAAFDATMKDADFLATAEKENMPVNPVSWQDTQDVVDKVSASSPELVEKAKAVLE
jgi:tripartite-type tricarboxylate transporter receptor subunit TctC